MEFNFNKIISLYFHGFDYITGNRLFTSHLNIEFQKEDVIEVCSFIKSKSKWEFKVNLDSYEGGIEALVAKYT